MGNKLLISIGTCCALWIGSSYAGVTADGTTAYRLLGQETFVIFSNVPGDDPNGTNAPLGAGNYSTGSGTCSYGFGGSEVRGMACQGDAGSAISTFTCATTFQVPQGASSWCLFAENPRVGDKAWAVKYLNGNVESNDGASIVRCGGTDTFNPATGCTPPVPLPTHISIEGGFIKLDVTLGTAPSGVDCDSSSHHGRMIVDDVNDFLYICTQSGWMTTPLDP